MRKILLTALVFSPLLHGCGAADVDDVASKEQALPRPGRQGFMIMSDSDVTLAVNAVGGAADGTILKLFKGCDTSNPDCTWTYVDGMIRSDSDQTLVMVPVGGANQGASIKLTRGCTSSNINCTWTYKNGQFFNDKNPALAINAFGGAAHLTELKLNSACASQPNNPDCTWSLRGAMLTAAPLTAGGPALNFNAIGGAANGIVVGLSAFCSFTNPDCTWTIRRGMIVSERDPHLALNAFGGAAFGTTLRLDNTCTIRNSDCTWTFKKGMILSDHVPSLAVNALGGRADGVALKLHNACTSTNPDCNFSLLTNGAGMGSMCGGMNQPACGANLCLKGTAVGGSCVPIEARAIACPASGNLNAGDASGNIILGISNTGSWSARGHAHDSGFWGLNYTLGIASASTMNGVQFGTVHSGVIHGTLDIGSRDDDYTDSGSDQRIIDNWAALKNSGFNCNLHSSVNPWLVGESALIGLGIAGAATLFGVGVAKGDCHLEADPPDGIMYRCTNSF